jgi:cupin 2 domain-containing protein
METRRLFPDFDLPMEGERFEELLSRKNVHIERILSTPGSSSGPYDQAQDEWVLLLQGRALLEVAEQQVVLEAGESLFLPAHTIHSVLDTSADPPCIWLAIHIGK